MDIIKIGEYITREESTAHVKFVCWGTTEQQQRTGDRFEIQCTNGIYSARLVRADSRVEEQTFPQSTIASIFLGFEKMFAYSMLCGGLVR